jgi:hypothetical protein
MRMGEAVIELLKYKEVKSRPSPPPSLLTFFVSSFMLERKEKI